MSSLGPARSQIAVERACAQVAEAQLADGHDLPSVYLPLGGDAASRRAATTRSWTASRPAPG